MPPELQQRRDALKTANARRMATAAIKREARAGLVLIPDLLMEPPEGIAHFTVIDVMLMGRSSIPSRAASTRAKLGRQALRDSVNLLLPIGVASQRTREWAADHAPAAVRRDAA